MQAFRRLGLVAALAAPSPLVARALVRKPAAPKAVVKAAPDLAAGLCLGARYYFTPGIGAFAELGYGQSFLKIGAPAKF